MLSQFSDDLSRCFLEMEEQRKKLVLPASPWKTSYLIRALDTLFFW